MWLDEHLSIRLERHSPVATSIVMEVPFPAESLAESGWELHGQIVGPHSAHARTLPTTLRFRPEADSPVGWRVVTRFPDFCGWSAEHPHRYRVTAELRRGSDVVERWERLWGVALLSLRGRHFHWEGRRWVMRAVEASYDQPLDWESHRDCDATCIRREPTEEECERADERGVRLVARLPISAAPDAQQLAAQLRRLDQHPSVILAWLDGEANWADLPEKLEAPGSLPIAMSIPRDVQGPLPSWLRVGIVEARDIDHLSSSMEEALSNRPLLVRQTWSEETGDVAAMRRGCDQLQADVAGKGEFAGYLREQDR